MRPNFSSVAWRAESIEGIEVTSSSTLRIRSLLGIAARAEAFRAVATTRFEDWATTWANAWPIPEEHPVTSLLLAAEVKYKGQWGPTDWTRQRLKATYTSWYLGPPLSHSLVQAWNWWCWSPRNYRVFAIWEIALVLCRRVEKGFYTWCWSSMRTAKSDQTHHLTAGWMQAFQSSYIVSARFNLALVSILRLPDHFRSNCAPILALIFGSFIRCEQLAGPCCSRPWTDDFLALSKTKAVCHGLKNYDKVHGNTRDTGNFMSKFKYYNDVSKIKCNFTDR